MILRVVRRNRLRLETRRDERTTRDDETKQNYDSEQDD